MIFREIRDTYIAIPRTRFGEDGGIGALSGGMDILIVYIVWEAVRQSYRFGIYTLSPSTTREVDGDCFTSSLPTGTLIVPPYSCSLKKSGTLPSAESEAESYPVRIRQNPSKD